MAGSARDGRSDGRALTEAATQVAHGEVVLPASGAGLEFHERTVPVPGDERPAGPDAIDDIGGLPRWGIHPRRWRADTTDRVGYPPVAVRPADCREAMARVEVGVVHLECEMVVAPEAGPVRAEVPRD